MRNNRAMGPDEIEGELLKHGGLELCRVIAAIINGIFATHESIEELKHGYIIPLNKPPKPCSISNVRPIVLLAMSSSSSSSWAVVVVVVYVHMIMIDDR